MLSFLAETAHRPYPLPAGPWVMRQTWEHLLFAHWPVPAGTLRALVPPQLDLDTHAGRAWLGVVPFGMRGVYPRHTRPVPGLSTFLELNVRTYVTVGGRRGVYFFSLDAANPVAGAIARAWYKLPYFNARMTAQPLAGDAWAYTSARTHRGAPPAVFRGRYRPAGPVFQAAPGSLEWFLTERYCLYTVAGGAVYRGEIHHAPWPLQAAEAELEVNTLAAAAGVPVAARPALLHFARQLETVEWPITRVS